MIHIFILGAMFGCVVAFFANELNTKLKNYFNDKKVVENSIKKLTKRMEIQNELTHLRIVLNCDRVAIISYNFDSESASMNYEICKFGTPEIIDSFQNLKTTKMIPMLLELEKRGYVCVDKTSDNETKLLHQNIGVVSSYKYKIKETIENGCLVVAYGFEHDLEINEVDLIFQTVKKLKEIYEYRS